jgi:hypothetical protein
VVLVVLVDLVVLVALVNLVDLDLHENYRKLFVCADVAI